MPKGHKPAQPPNKMPPLPTDSREAVQWFVNTVGLYRSSSRGLLVTEFGDEEMSTLDSAVIGLRSRGITPVVLDTQTVAAQATHLWQQAVHHTRFGRPLASQFELEVSGTDVLVLKDLDAPESAHHLWYLFHHIFFPRALAQKPTLVTSQLSLEELAACADECEDIEFAGRKVTWRKLMWLLEATCVDTEFIRSLKEQGLPPMLKVEHQLLEAVRERGLAVQPQFIIGDYMLDLAIVEKDRKVDIECDVLTTLDATGSNAWEAKKNLLLINDDWKVLKFGNTEVTSNVEACVDVVEEVWTQGRKRSTFGRLLSGQAATSIPELPGDDDLQRLAIMHGAGPCAVEGGAGTGKTSCVVHRVAFLLSQGISPDRILVISHSQETARTLKTAVELIADRQSVQRVSFHSWHDLGLKILKENLGAIKRKPPLKIEANPQKVIQRLLAKHRKDLDPTTLELSEELDEFTLASLVSLYKANMISAKLLKERSKSDVDELVAKVFQGYEDQLQKINRVDRDDMISLAAQVLVDHAEVAKKYQQHYDFVLVDEYQDATSAGDLLARTIAAPQDNLYFSGDEDESIYESKGGLPRLMADVSIRLPNARCYVLEKNWRSHPAIVDHSRQLIANLSRRRIAKDMISGWGPSQTGAIVGPQVSETEETEAQWVAEEISLLIDGGRDPNDIAVLYRYHRYGIIIEEALSRRGIKCESSHPEAGLIPDEVGDVMAFLRLVMDPDGPKARESFERVCQLRVKEIDSKLFATISSFAEVNNLSYLKAVEIYSEAVPDPACQDLRKLVNILRDMNQRNLQPADTIAKLRRTQGLNDYYKSIKVPPGVNYEPLQKLAQLEEDAKQFPTVSEFVKAQTSVVKQSSPNSKEPVEQVVHILTLHEAKGKEFAVVFLVGLAEGLFPADSVRDREEERRLCYVGMTRAKDLLYLSFPTVFNKVGLEPSSFLAEARLMAALPPSPGASPALDQPVPAPAPMPLTIPPANAPAPKLTPVAHIPTPILPSQRATAGAQVTPSVQSSPGAQASPALIPVAHVPPPALIPEAPAPTSVEAIPPPSLGAQASPPAPIPYAPAPIESIPQATHVPIPVHVPRPARPAPPPDPTPADPTPADPPPADPIVYSTAEEFAPAPEPAQPVPLPQPVLTPQPVPVQPQHVRPIEPTPQAAPIAQTLTPEPTPQAAPIAQALTPEATPQAAPIAQTLTPEPTPQSVLTPSAHPVHAPLPIPSSNLAPPQAAPTEPIAADLLLDLTLLPVQADLSIGVQQPPAKAPEAPAKAPFPSKGQGIARRVPRQQAPDPPAEDADKIAGVAGSAEAGKMAAIPGALSVVPDDMQRQYVQNLIQEVGQFDLFADRSAKNAESEESLGPVQAALQRRNAKKQGKNDPVQSPEEMAPVSEVQPTQEAPAANALPGLQLPNDQYTVEADLSIAHDKVQPERVIKHGLPPSSRKQKAKLQEATNPGAQAAFPPPAADVVPPFKPPIKLPAGAADILASWDADEETIASYDFTAAPASTPETVQAQSFTASPDPTLSSPATASSAVDASQPAGAGVFNYATADHDIEPTAKPKLEKLEAADGDVADLLAAIYAPRPPVAPMAAAPPAPAAPTPAALAPAPPAQAALAPAPHAPAAPASVPFASVPSPAPPSAPAPPSLSTPGAAVASDVEDLLAGLDLEERPSKYKKYKSQQAEPWAEEPSPEPPLPPDTEPLTDRPRPPRPAWAPPPGAIIESQGYSPATPLPSSISHRAHCTTCNAELESGSRFCGECGTFQQSRIPACHLCGSPLEPSAKFCGECGSPRVDETPPVPVTSGGGDVPNMDSPEYRAYLAAQEKPRQKNWMVKLLKMLEQ